MVVGLRTETMTDPPAETDMLGPQPRPDQGPPAQSGETLGDGPTPPGTALNDLDVLAPSERPSSLGRIGSYEVLHQIGRGGMGIVLKALDCRLDRAVAIKVLAPALAGDALAQRRFLREARAAAAVSHEHVVTIHAVDEVAGQPYIVMQLVTGRSLQGAIDRRGPLETEAIVRVGMQIALGLAAAHAKGLIHRDIKPANILLEEPAERVKITDFGLARTLDDASLTRSGTIVGTPYFMSPEQARGDPVDRRTDLFSLGGVMYAMCTGQPPFRAESTVAVLRKVSDDAPPPIGGLNPQIPAWLVELIAKLMAKDPAARYQTAHEVSEILARHLAELRPSAQPGLSTTIGLDPPAPNTAHRSRRSGALAVAACATVVGAGLAVWWWIAHQRAKFDTPAQLSAEASARTRTAITADTRPIDERGTNEPGAALGSAVTTATRDTDPPSKRAPAEPAAVAVSAETARRARDQINIGDAQVKRSEFTQAIEHFSEAIRLDPSRPDAFVRRADVHVRARVANWRAAVVDLTEALRLEPASAATLERRAYAYLRAGDARRAIDDATEAIRLEPKLVAAYAHRGAAYSSLAQWEHAIVDLDLHLRRAPDSPWSLYPRALAHLTLGHLDRARSDADKTIELIADENLFWNLRARVRIAQGDRTGAFADLDRSTRIGTAEGKYNAHALRGEIEVSLSMIDPAIDDFTAALRLAPATTHAQATGLYVGRASLYLARGEVGPALIDFDESIRLGSTSSFAYLHRGVAHVRKAQFDRAIADFDAAARLAGTDKYLVAGCILNRADALAMSGRIDQAEAAYAEAIKVEPTRLHSNLLLRAWFIDRPRADYKKALDKLNETAGGAMVIQFLYRGLIHARLGQPDRALADFDEIARRMKVRTEWFSLPDYLPHRLAVSIGRTEAYLQKADLDRANAEIDDAVRLYPTSREARLLRAEVQSRRGKIDLAQADRLEASRLKPDPLLTRP
jgi:tetratricopeptide (TPR) repeat protein